MSLHLLHASVDRAASAFGGAPSFSVQSLGVFDWLILAMLGWSTVRALFRGLILELFLLAGLIAGLVVAGWEYGALAATLRSWAPLLPMASVLAFALLAIGSMLLCGFLGRALRRGAATVGLGIFDRIAGAGFGFVRGCLLGALLVTAAASFAPLRPALLHSRLAPYLLAGPHAVSSVVPQDLQEQIRDSLAAVKHTEPRWIKPSP